MVLDSGSAPNRAHAGTTGYKSSAVILRCSPFFTASLEGGAASARGRPSRRRARARLSGRRRRLLVEFTNEVQHLPEALLRWDGGVIAHIHWHANKPGAFPARGDFPTLRAMRLMSAPTRRAPPERSAWRNRTP